ncbi:MAG: XdhC family protein [Bacteroidota bacterium]
MRELLQILHKAGQLADAGQKFALATVVKIGGSTYRRPGARMLISASGERWGALSGGCLEGEVAQQALEVMASGHPRLIPFNLAEDDIVLGFGTGCNGVVHVLIQPLEPAATNTVIDALQHAVYHRRTSVMATIIEAASSTTAANDPGLGDHLLIDESNHVGPSNLGVSIKHAVALESNGFLEAELSNPQMYLWHTRKFITPDCTYQVLFEFVRPPAKLFIFGEGYDVHAVVAQGALMGWEVVIVGRKPVDVLKDRFQLATDWKFLMHPEDVAANIQTDLRCAALVMNHTYSRDRAIMHHLLQTNIPYIGMLGPRERTQDMLTADEAFLTPSEEDQDRIFGPVGLDIGTETPEEIALSAISEIQAVLHKRAGASLRQRNSPIHSTRSPLQVSS